MITANDRALESHKNDGVTSHQSNDSQKGALHTTKVCSERVLSLEFLGSLTLLQ